MQNIAIATQYIHRKKINECTRIMLNGIDIQILRFADDIAIKAQDKINLKRELESSDKILNSNYRMKINRIKAEVMVCCKNRDNINIKMDDDVLNKYQNSSTYAVYLQKMENIRKT